MLLFYANYRFKPKINKTLQEGLLIEKVILTVE
jgi:hypothetical protein